MWGYQKNPSWEWENAAAEGLAGLVILALIVVAAVVATLLIIVCTELGRIYQRRGFSPTATARALWIALAGLLACWLVAGLLATSPATLAAGLYLAAWAFLAFVIAVEACDQYEQRFDPAPLGTDWDAAIVELPAPADSAHPPPETGTREYASMS
jgi:hypothetical protein